MSAPLAIDELGLGFVGYTREEGEAMLRGETLPEPVASEFSCVHRSGLLEIGVCDLCGIRGKPFEILSCAVHGKCSIGRKKRKIRSCLQCDDRIPVASGDPEGVS